MMRNHLIMTLKTNKCEKQNVLSHLNFEKYVGRYLAKKSQKPFKQRILKQNEKLSVM